MLLIAHGRGHSAESTAVNLDPAGEVQSQQRAEPVLGVHVAVDVEPVLAGLRADVGEGRPDRRSGRTELVGDFVLAQLVGLLEPGDGESTRRTDPGDLG